MAHATVCRVCLVDDVRMHVLTGTPLQEVYEKLTNTSLIENAMPVTACYLCCSELKRCQQFLEKITKANEMLIQILNCGAELTQNSIKMIDRQSLKFGNALEISPIQSLAIDSIILIKEENSIKKYECQIKGETIKDSPKKFNIPHISDSEDDLPLNNISTRRGDESRPKKSIKLLNDNSHKQELIENAVKVEMSDLNGEDEQGGRRNGDYEEDLNQLTDVGHTRSDSEDDVPLQSISTNKERRKVHSRIRKKKGKREIKKVFKMDAREILLTKEEQLQELMERSKTLNYLNSPYKCNLCYKGFVDLRAYDNHKEKHDERRGPHECDVCRLRYSSVRQLRSHAIASHGRRYACARCPHRAHTANQAREHEKWHNGYTYECQLCSQKFRKPTSYLTHMRKRHPTEHVCETCGASFVGRHGLLMHKSKTHRIEDKSNPELEEPATDRYCTDCNIQFVSVDAWKRHMLSSVKHKLASENSAECGICGARVSATARAEHRRAHEKALRPTSRPATACLTRLACEQCGANFVNRSKLQAHIKRIHLGLKYNKNIVCEVCGKKCTSNASLKYHQRTHTGEKPYSCTTCSKSFADNNQLRIHTRTHTGERPYCCAVCGKRFSQKPALNRHYRVHTGAKPYECQFCSKTFSQSNSLKLHVRTVHLKMPSNNKRNKVQNQEDTEKKEEEIPLQAI
ncbi:uncharacterized protein ACR2FA_010860 [Aphomia sociella]